MDVVVASRLILETLVSYARQMNPAVCSRALMPFRSHPSQYMLQPVNPRKVSVAQEANTI